MSRKYPYATEKTPIAIVEARLRLVEQLDRVYSRALDERIEYCKANGIKYLGGICKPSPDAMTEKLYVLAVNAHAEAVLLNIRVAELTRERYA